MNQKNNLRKTQKKPKTLVLLDSHAIIHRAFHALPSLTNPAGEPMGAVYGFATILLRILQELKPDYLAAAFDLEGPTFRHAAYARYKAQRPETPKELLGQFDGVKKLVRAFDIIGTLATALPKKHKDLKIVIV